jgi:hypothetical protein
VGAGILTVLLLSLVVGRIVDAVAGDGRGAAGFAAGLVLTAVVAVAGGYVAGRLAPNRATMHALGAGAGAVVVDAVTMRSAWSATPAATAASLVVLMVGAWIGGSIAQGQRARGAGAVR